MPSVLLTGSYEQADPGAKASLAAIRAALPDWDAIAVRDGAVGAAAGNGRAPASPRAIRHVLRADAAVLTGRVFEARGGDGRSGGASAALVLATAMKARGRPRAILGASAPPLRTRPSRAIARALVQRAGLLVLRDEESAQALAETGAAKPFRVGADPAWLEAGGPEPPAPAREERIVVVLGSGRGRLTEGLALAVAPLAASGLTVRLLPWVPRARGFAGALAGRLKQAGGVEIAEPPASLAVARRELAGSRAVIGLRYHALVAAAAAGVPCVALGGEPGLSGLARRLGQRALPASADPAEITAAAGAAMARAPAGTSAVEFEIASAGESLRLLRLLLSGGRSEDPSELEGLPLEPVPHP